MMRRAAAGLVAAMLLAVSASAGAEPYAAGSGAVVGADAEAGPAATYPAAEQDYILHCRGCHRPDGSGVPDHGVPSLVGHMARFLSVPGGREYLVQVPGTAQSPLDDAATAQLLNWMLREFSPQQIPAGFRPYDAAEVGRWRARTLVDPVVRRRELLAEFGSK